MDEVRSATSGASDDEAPEPVLDHAEEVVEAGVDAAAADADAVAEPAVDEDPTRGLVPRTSGPPADWVERVRRHAPWLLTERPAMHAAERLRAPTPAGPRAAPDEAGRALDDPAHQAYQSHPGAETRPEKDAARRELAGEEPDPSDVPAAAPALDRTSQSLSPPATDHGPALDHPLQIEPGVEVGTAPEVLPSAPRDQRGQPREGATGVADPDRAAAPAQTTAGEPRARSATSPGADVHLPEPPAAEPPRKSAGVALSSFIEARPNQLRAARNDDAEEPPVQVRRPSPGSPVVEPPELPQRQSQFQQPTPFDLVTAHQSRSHERADHRPDPSMLEAWPELPPALLDDDPFAFEAALRGRERWQRLLREQELA